VADQIGVGTINWGGALALSSTWEALTTTNSDACSYAFAADTTSNYATLYVHRYG
jgi:hypothetical protein